MDIPALSISLNQMKVQLQASTSVMKMAMTATSEQSIDLLQMLEANTKMMEQSVNPHIGRNIDIKL
ncbi:YjfB family protein [Tepidimicrobium xylanilyticum]